MTARAVLTDIEGTTTDLAFVRDVLFPLARREIPAYVRARFDDPSLAPLRAAIARDVGASADAASGVSAGAAIDRLMLWMDEDRKETHLKQLQGELWRAAYADGSMRAHVYPDVRPAFERWTAAGHRVFVFSSGSVDAQRLIFGHSTDGDLTPYLSGYFDTVVGPKREPASYRTIADRIGALPGDVLFLSDVIAELDAARAAGMRTGALLRPGVPAPPPSSTHPTHRTFETIEP